MNKIGFLPRENRAWHNSAKPRRRDSSPKAVKILMPLWGDSYVGQFLEYGLPTLLAPGNVPAVAVSLPTEFVFLTSAEDEEAIAKHPSFIALAAICNTSIRRIDHLITDGNYSTTITLAYAESIRATYDAMLNTCFFLLVSDYIVADGSLANVLSRMLRGTSAVISGNFQVARETALPWLMKRSAGADKTTLALSARALISWGLGQLHPVTLANTIDVRLVHNSQSNRLFWRVDEHTILGRFYLMHTLCIRPELTQFVVGSSFDYSFIPEMCPSGNVEAVTDSDEFLVVEMQPSEHEIGLLRPGPADARTLARSLSEWTTSVHRGNARHSLIFHAGELPLQLAADIAKADAFVAKIASRLKREPMPFRGHPYWLGAIAAFESWVGPARSGKSLWDPLSPPGGLDGLAQWVGGRAKFVVMGRPPHVRPWHPFWPDYKAVLRSLKPFFIDPTQRLLMISDRATAFTTALAREGAERAHRLRAVDIVKKSPQFSEIKHDRFDVCLLEIGEKDMARGHLLIERIARLMKPDGQIIVVVTNRRLFDAHEFNHVVTHRCIGFSHPNVLPTAIYFVPRNGLRSKVIRDMGELRGVLNRGTWIGIPMVILGASLLLCISFLGNLLALAARRSTATRLTASSLIMLLRVASPKPISPWRD
jgi:hypothetical protein